MGWNWKGNDNKDKGETGRGVKNIPDPGICKEKAGRIMERIDEQVFYTKEDEQGFSFFLVPEEEKREMLLRFRKKRKKHIFLFGMLLFPALVIYWVSHNADIDYFTSLYMVIIFFWFGLDLFCLCRNIKGVKKGDLYYAEVELLKKLPVETEKIYHVDTPNETCYFYPVIGRDTTSGYETLCFVEKEQYENSSEHTRIKLIRKDIPKNGGNK